MSVVSSSVTSSMTPTLSTTAHLRGEHTQISEVGLVAGVPNFASLRCEQGHRYRLRKSTSTSDLLANVTDVCLELNPESVLASIKMAPSPFAKGAMKAAYYGWDCSTSQAVVFKQTMATDASDRTIAKYEAFLACHHAAAYFANRFNVTKPTNCNTVSFVKTCIVQMYNRLDQPYVLQEEQLVGTYEKFNSNGGYCNASPTIHGTEHSSVQAFSHWTHHVTGGALMVVDCQGVYCANTRTFKLTDPAIHATALTRFGGTNMGRVGFERFYKTHVCNAHCRAMGLSAGR
jgi:hypothetical protein